MVRLSRGATAGVALLLATATVLGGWGALDGRLSSAPVGGSGAARSAPSASANSLGALFDANGAPLGGREVRALAPSTLLSFEAGLMPTNYAGMEAYASAVQDPSSPLFHHYLSLSQFEQRFAPSPREAAQVESYFAGVGASDLSLTSDRMTLTFLLSAGDVPAAFGTSLGYYANVPGVSGDLYAPTSPPSLPSLVASDLVGVDGLTDRGSLQEQGMLVKDASFRTSGPSVSPGLFDNVVGGSQAFWGTDFQGVYNELPLLNAGDTGAGWSVDTILWSGYNVSESENLPPWDPTAVSDYFQATFPNGAALPDPVAEPVTVAGFATPPQPGQISATGLGDDLGAEVENSLDLEMVGSTAPGASIYCFYLPGQALVESDQDLYSFFDTALSNALSFHYPGKGLAAVSNSYGLSDANDSGWNTLEVQAETMGVSIVVSSGDAGNAPEQDTGRPQGEWPPWPASAAFQTAGVTAVGATTVTVTGTGGTWTDTNQLPPMSYDATGITGVQDQVGWYTNNTAQSETAGSEGGVSTVVPEPLWQAQSAAQTALAFATAKEGLTTIDRGIPDISYVGNETIIYIGSGGGIFGAEVGGTSVASPVFAGFLAVIASANGVASGYLDPDLYAMGSYFEVVSPSNASNPFHGQFAVSSTTSHNFVFNGSVGWNAVTGWGTPDVSLLQQDLEDKALLSYVYNPNAQPGKGPNIAGPPAPSSGFSFLDLILIAVVVCAVFLVLVAVVAARRSRRGAAAAPPAAYPSAPAPAYGYGQPAPGYGYGSPGAYGAPAYSPYPPVVYAPPPPSPYAPSPYAAPAYPGYGYPYGQPATGGYAPAPQPVSPAPYYCRYCRSPRPYSQDACPVCGAPL